MISVKTPTLPTHCRCLMAMALLFLGWSAQSAGLKDIQLDSFLGEPLKATLVIDYPLDADPARLDLSVGGSTDYRLLDIVRPAVIDSVNIGLPTIRDGQWVAGITSSRRVDDLVLDLIVVLSEKGSRNSRHFPLLMDFPTEISPPSSTVVERMPPPPETTISRPLAPVPSASRRTTDPSIEATPGRQYGPVRSGQSLYQIAQEVAAPGQDIQWLADAIVSLNPQAFINGDPDRLMAGRQIRLPAEADLKSGSNPGAGANTPLQRTPSTELDNSGGQAFSRAGQPEREDRVRLRAPPAAEAIVESIDKWLDSSAGALDQGRLEIQRDLSFARTEIDTHRNQNAVMRDQVSALEDRVRNMQRLLELREQQQAEAQDSLRQGRQSVADAGDRNAASPASLVTLPVDSTTRPNPATTDEASADAALDSSNDSVSLEPQPQSNSDSTALPWLTVALIAIALIGIIGLVLFALRRRNRPERQEFNFENRRSDHALLPDDLDIR